MLKPYGYDEAQAFGEREVLELGGHHMTIMGVEETQSKNGKDMLKVYLDTASNDKQPLFFTNRYRQMPDPIDKSKKKSWPYDGTSYIMVLTKENKTNGNLKGFLTSVEDSNPGFSIVWGDNFCQSLKGKKVGAVYGLELDIYNGKEVKRHRLKYFCSDEKVDAAAIPDQSETDDWKVWKGVKAATVDPDFMSVSDSDIGELPFM